METLFTYQDFIGSSSGDGASAAHFRILDDLAKPDLGIVTELIKTDVFLRESWHEDAKKYPDKPYLGPVFNYDLVCADHFRQYNKDQFFQYLKDYFDTLLYAEYQLNIIKHNIDWIRNDIGKGLSDTFFVINMDWFDKADKIISQTERYIYPYFVGIFCLDREHCLVSYYELFWD